MYKAIQTALDKNYCITDEGAVFGPRGKINLKISGSQKYPTFSVSGVPGVKNKYGVFGIPAHKFAACFFFGLEKTKSAECVRHLDGNVLNLSRTNLVLGTHSENNLDKDPAARRLVAQKARASQIRPGNAKFTNEQIIFIKTSMLSGAELSRMFGVTRQAIFQIRKGKNYADITI